jgi:hypothetical protein
VEILDSANGFPVQLLSAGGRMEVKIA